MIRALIRIIKWVLSLLLVATPGALAQVVKVVDADTLQVNLFWPYGLKTVRLWGVDAPELKQQKGQQCKAYLEGLLLNRFVLVEKPASKAKSYNRTVSRVKLLNGSDLSEHLVKSGYAWDAPKYSNGKYAKLQQKATKSKKGIWSTGGNENPETFRRKKLPDRRVYT